jgi:hypothetical protein
MIPLVTLMSGIAFFATEGMYQMQFFTRSWYGAFQGGLQFQNDAQLGNHFQEASQRYNCYLDGVRERMDDDAYTLAQCYLHDFRVTAFCRDDAVKECSLELAFESTRHPHSTTIHFSDVTAAKDVDGISGQHVLYHEVLLKDEGSYEFSALLDKSEILIAFRHVRLQACRGEANT